MPNGKSACKTSSDDAPKTRSSGEPLEQVVEGDPRKQLEMTVSRYKPGEWKYEFKMSSLATMMLNLLFTEGERKGKTEFQDVHRTWFGRFECRQAVP